MAFKWVHGAQDAAALVPTALKVAARGDRGCSQGSGRGHTGCGGGCAVCLGRSDLIHTSLISDLFPLRTSKESSLSSKSHPFRHKVFLFPEQP